MTTALQPTRAQQALLEELCLQNGTCEVSMHVHSPPMGLTMHVHCANSLDFTVDENGRIA